MPLGESGFVAPAQFSTPNDISGNAATATSVGGITGKAVKSDQTTGSSTALAVTPAVQQNHDSALKMWANISGNGTNNASFNVTSVVRNSAGNYTVTLTTGFTSVNYVVSAIPTSTSFSVILEAEVDIVSATVFNVLVSTYLGVATDPTKLMLMGAGRQ